MRRRLPWWRIPARVSVHRDVVITLGCRFGISFRIRDLEKKEEEGTYTRLFLLLCLSASGSTAIDITNRVGVTKTHHASRQRNVTTFILSGINVPISFTTSVSPPPISFPSTPAPHLSGD
ncbi:Uncharacterized protein Rs2_18011 [Raphanus sativus]|nr:Uncharacterized protein Rs2_18011 [Raphanus sativus]